MSVSALDDALAYAEHYGFAVHPVHNLQPDGACTCSKGSTDHDGYGKHPWSEHGLNDASTDPATIRALWEGKPTAQVAVNCGASGIVVLDTDVHGDTDGRPTWAALVAEYPTLDAAPMAETPHDGWHAFYRLNGEHIGLPPGFPLGEGIDVKGIGGYVILPSAASVGRDWIPGHELNAVPLPGLPPAVVKRLTFATKKPSAAPAKKRAKVREGGRNAYLCDRALAMRRCGFTVAQIAAALQVVNEQECKPPRTAEHVAGIAARYAKLDPKPYEDAADRPAGHARVVCMADVAPVAVTWLWPGRIPEAKIALLIGDPGMGKTMLALDIVARVTRGTAFPDGTQAPAGDVVILTAEDGLADTIRPRLDAAGADVSRVWVIQAVTSADDAGGKLFSLAGDVGALEDVVSEHRARLVMIDPLDGYLRGIDSHRNSEVRGVLAPWAAMLERTGATGLGVHHLNKDSSTVNALYRAGGSLAFVAAARAVFGVAPDPDCEGRSLFLPMKLNIAAKPPGLGYRVTDHGIEWDSDPVTCDAATAFGGTKRADSDLVSAAKDFLRASLVDGQYVPQVALEEAASELGIASKSLRKAKEALGVESKREGFGAGGLWYWRLPRPLASNRE